jgi:hypothetical protein
MGCGAQKLQLIAVGSATTSGAREAWIDHVQLQ